MEPGEGGFDLYEEALLELTEVMLGERHPQTLASMAELAHLYVWQGRIAEAEALFGRALALAEAVLPAGHPEIGWMLAGLARVRAAQGEADAARELAERGLAIVAAALGADHARTLRARETIAPLLGEGARHAPATPRPTGPETGSPGG